LEDFAPEPESPGERFRVVPGASGLLKKSTVRLILGGAALQHCDKDSVSIGCF